MKKIRGVRRELARHCAGKILQTMGRRQGIWYRLGLFISPQTVTLSELEEGGFYQVGPTTFIREGLRLKTEVKE